MCFYILYLWISHSFFGRSQSSGWLIIDLAATYVNGSINANLNGPEKCLYKAYD